MTTHLPEAETPSAGREMARHGAIPWQQRLATLAAWVRRRNGWSRRGLALGAGALSVLALAPFFAWPVLFVTLPVLVWLLDGCESAATATDATRGAPALSASRQARTTALRAAGVGWWFAFGYFFFGLFWIGEAFLVDAARFAWLLPVAVTSMPAGLALFYAAAAAAAVLTSRPGLERVLALAVTLAVAEWLRGHVLTGFPWNVLGYALTWPLPLMQSAALVGIYGLTLWAVVIFAAPLVMAADRAQGGRPISSVPLIIALAPLVAMAIYGFAALSRTAPPDDAARVRIVQPSIPQWEKWQPQNQRSIFELHLELSRQNPAGDISGLNGIDLVVWPEVAMPFFPLENQQVLSEIRAVLGPTTRVISGGLRRAMVEPPDAERSATYDYFNSLLIIAADDAQTRIYDKIHLVPFGEYLPLQATLEWLGLEQLTRLRGGFTAGASPRPVLDGIGPLICYEAIFPAAVVQGAERPRVFVNVTNDGWFGNTTGPRQHLHQARVRAVEEGIPLIRSANNGISAMIDADGRLLGQLGMDVKGVMDFQLPGARPAPPYARWGDAIFLLNLLIFTLLWLYVRRTRAPSHA